MALTTRTEYNARTARTAPSGVVMGMVVDSAALPCKLSVDPRLDPRSVPPGLPIDDKPSELSLRKDTQRDCWRRLLPPPPEPETTT
jgi:hypothetical protein